MIKGNAMMKKTIFTVLAALFCACAFCETERIIVKNGEFVTEKTNKRFVPIGANYVKLNEHPQSDKLQWHCTFAPREWDKKQAEAALKEMKKSGFNITKVFIDYFEWRGVIENEQAETFHKPYMDNLINFISMAEENDIRVIIALTYTPVAPLTAPRKIVPIDKSIAGSNLYYLEKNTLERKKIYVKEFTKYLKQKGRKCFNNIFAIELFNEETFGVVEKPFDGETRRVKAPNGKSYGLKTSEDMQKLIDEASIYYANMMADSIRQADRDMLVSASMLTYNAVGKSGPGKILEDMPKYKGLDHRYPMRPMALLESKLSYIDVHILPVNAEWLKKDLKSIEFEELKEKAKESGKPMIVGKIGIARGWGYTKEEQIKGWFENVFAPLSREGGFQGFIWWTWDADNELGGWVTAKDSKFKNTLDMIEENFKQAQKRILESE